MTGKRVFSKQLHELQSGEYTCIDGGWYARVPSGGSIANLASHQIVEHEDSTITVSPSIEVNGYLPEHHWHGFLERGVWRDA